ncbi:MAG: HAAS signaling domain-containing protein [Nocardioides sp.]|uniref:HAAS signaling domain-containing protein n=1 Tax=Nocardioides sp. TaxID=35761 RepID=UPI003D6BCB68
MTTTDAEATVAPEVRLFLARVRRELADLDPEAVADITDGLEADFAELVGERGPDALGDPVEYAKELRAAAGIPAGKKARRGFAERVDGQLDAGHDVFDRAVERLGGVLRTDLAPVVAWLRPAWWIARAWAAVWLVGGFFGWSMSVPATLLLMVPAVAVSVFIGLGRIWPGGARRTGARVVALAMNMIAVAVLFAAWATSGASTDYSQGWDDGYSHAVSPNGEPLDEIDGVLSSGREVSNIYPYDASGKPLTGVQLFDQDGRPIKAGTRPECVTAEGKRGTGESYLGADGEETYECIDPDTGETFEPRVFYPWTNGAVQLYNVFPLPSRVQPDAELDPNAFDGEDAPAIQVPRMATVPEVSAPDKAATASPSPYVTP